MVPYSHRSPEGWWTIATPSRSAVATAVATVVAGLAEPALHTQSIRSSNMRMAVASSSLSVAHDRVELCSFRVWRKSGANYSNFGTPPIVWSLKIKLAPKFNVNELDEISSEI